MMRTLILALAFAIAGCGAEVAPAQDIGIVEPTQTAAEPRISADAAERAGQQDPGDAPGTHKPPPDFRP